MMFLHDDKELFKEVVVSTSEKYGVDIPIIEKDYYVTMILKLLSEYAPDCVFKGGTSLSKCHHIIDRFSEDIDIAFNKKLNGSKRKILKNNIIAKISTTLNLPIIDWNNTRSRRDYNCYTFSYERIAMTKGVGKLTPGVKMEVVLSSVSFPTIKLPVDSYIYNFLKEDNDDLIKQFNLEPFTMNVQDINRTLIDKVFAICDYYLQNKIKLHSRHLYDIHMLLPKINISTNEFKSLISQVRETRSNMQLCPSAKADVNISHLLKTIVDEEVYKTDYLEITSYFQNHPIDYDLVIKSVITIADSGIF